MRNLFRPIILLILCGYMTSFIRAQVGFESQCALLGITTFFLSDRLLCEEEKEEEKFDLATGLCKSRPFDSIETCLRCIQKRENRKECNSDLGSNGVNDDVTSIENDDCQYDEEFEYCFDEFPEESFVTES